MIITLIPAYNAEYTIAKVVVNCSENADLVLAYDDGSTDDTYSILKCLNVDELMIYHNAINRGKGYALKYLFSIVSSDKVNFIRRQFDRELAIVTIDADDQHNPYEITRLVQPIIDGKADVVIGEKKLSKTPFVRRVGTVALDLLYGSGSQSGFRAYNEKFLDIINITTNGFGADTQLLRQAQKANLRIACVPITIKYHHHSHTKNIVSQFLEIMKNGGK